MDRRGPRLSCKNLQIKNYLIQGFPLVRPCQHSIGQYRISFVTLFPDLVPVMLTMENIKGPEY